MSEGFAVFFWALLVIYALTVAAQIFGHSFGKPRWVAVATWGYVPAGEDPAAWTLHSAK